MAPRVRGPVAPIPTEANHAHLDETIHDSRDRRRVAPRHCLRRRRLQPGRSRLRCQHDAGHRDPGRKPACAAAHVGTLAVAEVKITTPTAAPLPTNLGGASISLAFSDITQGGGRVVTGDPAPGSCLVTEYDGGATPTLKPNPVVGEGTITIAGAAVKKTTPPCNVGGSYVCAAAPVTGAAGTVATQSGVTVLSVTGTTFTADALAATSAFRGSRTRR